MNVRFLSFKSYSLTTAFIHGACIKAMQTASRNASQKKRMGNYSNCMLNALPRKTISGLHVLPHLNAWLSIVTVAGAHKHLDWHSYGIYDGFKFRTELFDCYFLLLDSSLICKEDHLCSPIMQLLELSRHTVMKELPIFQTSWEFSPAFGLYDGPINVKPGYLAGAKCTRSVQYHQLWQSLHVFSLLWGLGMGEGMKDT